MNETSGCCLCDSNAVGTLSRSLEFVPESCDKCGRIDFDPLKCLSLLTQQFGGYEKQLAKPVNPFQKLISQYGTRKKSGESK